MKVEHELFVEALTIFGKDWPKVVEHVNSRTKTSVINYANSFQKKYNREPNMVGIELIKKLEE